MQHIARRTAAQYVCTRPTSFSSFTVVYFIIAIQLAICGLLSQTDMIYDMIRFWFTEHAGNWLTEMPRGLYQLEALEALSVAGNRITHLSSNVAQLTRLRLLDVSDNALRSLPKVLSLIHI